MVAFDEISPLQALEERLEAALQFRLGWFDPQQTNAYRLVNGEGDGVPGLIVDCYHDVIVLQSSTLGMDRLKPWIVDWLNRRLQPALIYEKSLLPSRREEGLKELQGRLSGHEREEVSFRENGLLFTASLPKSQKTGFFLDQREMRQWVRSLASGKRVLNAFSYTGGFSVYALAGGALQVDSLDISQEAIERARSHVALNGYSERGSGFYVDDVFLFLRREESLPYDFVILDPPAFAKKKQDVVAGCRGYKDINRLAMAKMPPSSLLLTSSCSYHVDESLFQKVLFQAALEAHRRVRIIGRHRLAPDHPLNLYHPEGSYLKSFLLLVE